MSANHGIDKNDSAGQWLRNKGNKGKKKSKTRERTKTLRTALLMRYRLNEHTSTLLLAEKICEEVGIESPCTQSQCRKIVARIGKNIIKTESAKKSRFKKTPDDEFFKSRKWKELRYIALRNSEGSCNLCGATAQDGAQIHVDHIKSRSKYPELEYDLDNLQVLCGDCNFGKTNAFEDDWRAKGI